MQDCTDVPLRAGRYLLVHEVVTYGEAECARYGANATGGWDIATKGETCQARGWFSTLSPESGMRKIPTLELTGPRPSSRAGVWAGGFSSHE